MDALRRSVGGAEPAKLSKPSKKPRKQLLFVVNGRFWRKADVRPECHAASGGERAQPDWENRDIEI
jgi:hypothetical protein